MKKNDSSIFLVLWNYARKANEKENSSTNCSTIGEPEGPVEPSCVSTLCVSP